MISIFLQLTTAGADTGPDFDLYSDADSFNIPFATAVSKGDLQSGYFTSAPNETTTVRIKSVSPPSLCDVYEDVVLSTTTSTSTSTSSSSSTTTTTTTTIVCELWRNTGTGETVVTYTNCEGTVITNYTVATTDSICARTGSITVISGDPLTYEQPC